MREGRKLVKARFEGFWGFWGLDLQSGACKGGEGDRVHKSAVRMRFRLCYFSLKSIIA